jgi:hypothetical protein
MPTTSCSRSYLYMDAIEALSRQSRCATCGSDSDIRAVAADSFRDKPVLQIGQTDDSF